MRVRAAFLLLVTLLLAGCTLGVDPYKHPLTSIANIQLPRPAREAAGIPSLDLLTVDSRNGLLYVPYANALDVVDTRTRKLRGQVMNLPGIKSIALSHDPNIIFTADGGNNAVAVVDVSKLTVLQEIKTPLGNPDASVYDPNSDVVVVSQSGPSPDLVFIDATARKVIGSLKLPSGPELMALDPQSSKVYLAMHDENDVFVIDVPSRQHLETYKGCSIQNPVGMAYDPTQGRLFVANGVLHTANVVSIIDVVLDKCLGTIDIGHGPDQAAFNSHLHHVYVANSGTSDVSVIDTVAIKPLGTNGTGRAAHSIAVDPATDLVYVGVETAGIIAVYHDR